MTRKQSMLPDALLHALEMIRLAQSGHGTHLTEDDLRAAVEQVVSVTADTYTRESASYAELREQRPSAWDEYMTDILLRTVRHGIAEGRLPAPRDGRWRLLDVGAGHGRDLLRFAQESDTAPVALENAPGFVALLQD